MHRIPKNQSQIYSEQSISGAEEAPSSSGSKRRAESSSSLVSSPLANKRKRGDATQGGEKRRSLGPFNLQRGTVQTVQSEIAPDHGLGVGIGTIDNLEEVISSLLYPELPPQVFSPPIDFGTQPEVSSAPDEGGSVWDLSEYLINDEEDDQPERLDTEMTMGSQGTKLSEILFANLLITDLLKPSSDFGDPANVSQDFSLNFLDEWASYYKNDQPESQDTEMSLEGELEANHAALSANDFQAVEGNTGQQVKLKGAKHVKWTPKLEGMARNIVQANANRELNGKELYARLEEECNAQKPKLACPSCVSFRIKFLEKSSKTRVLWTDKLEGMARNIVQANANRGLNGKELYARLEEECNAQNNAQKPKLTCPSYNSFRENFLEKSRATRVLWTDKLKEMVSNIAQANANRELNGKELYDRLEEECNAHKPKLACPGYRSFVRNFLEKNDKDFEMDFETEPKDSHSALLSGEPQGLAKNANPVEQKQIEKNLRLGAPRKDREGIKNKIRALIEANSLLMRPAELKAEFSKAYPDERCPLLPSFSYYLKQMKQERVARNPELTDNLYPNSRS